LPKTLPTLSQTNSKYIINTKGKIEKKKPLSHNRCPPENVFPNETQRKLTNTISSIGTSG
jgi:hypothetical protein